MAHPKPKEDTQLARVEPQAVPAPQNDGAAILAMMDKIIAMPDLPVERLEQMFTLHLKMQAEQARKEWAVAFAGAMREIGPVIKDRENKQTKSWYATHAALDKVLRPVYTKYGLNPTFTTEKSDLPEHIKVVGHLVHEGGHERRYEVDMPADGKGAKGGDVMTKTHAAGSAMHYGKRYLLIDMFNIAVADKMDDDGNAAGGKLPDSPLTDEQIDELRALIGGVGANEEKFCATLQVDGLGDLMQSQMQNAKGRLMAWARKNSAFASRR